MSKKGEIMRLEVQLDEFIEDTKSTWELIKDYGPNYWKKHELERIKQGFYNNLNIADVNNNLYAELTGDSYQKYLDMESMIVEVANELNFEINERDLMRKAVKDFMNGFNDVGE